MRSGRTNSEDGSAAAEQHVPAVAYVRMSTDHQKYSTENQLDVLRSYAQVAPDHVIYLDVEPVVPDGRAYWNDICHFNDAGERLWLDAMVGAVKAATL